MNTSGHNTDAQPATSSNEPARGWHSSDRARTQYTAGSVRVLLACGVRLYREGLSYSLAQRAAPRVQIVATAATAQEALAQTHTHRPELVLLDSALPDCVSVAREIMRHVPETRVLVLAINESDDNVIAIAEAGVSGYVPRDGSHDDLMAAIERAARGEVLCPPNIVASLFRRMAIIAGERSPGGILPGLTDREREVVLLLGEGVSNKEIARRLSIRVATVKNHVHNILQKLGVNRRFAVAALLMRQRDTR